MSDESSNLQYLNMHWNAAHHHNRYMRNSNAWLPVAVDRECAYRQMAKYSIYESSIQDYLRNNI